MCVVDGGDFELELVGQLGKIVVVDSFIGMRVARRRDIRQKALLVRGIHTR
jgi:hypothetical protein